MRRYKIVLKLPSRFRRWRLRRATERGAREEAGQPKPFVYEDAQTGAQTVEVAPFQLRVVRAVHDWLEALEVGSATALRRLRGRYHEQRRRTDAVAAELEVAKTKVRDVLKFGGHGALAVIILVAGASMNFLVNWSFVSNFGWDFSTTVFADLVLVLAEVMATCFVGRGVAACVLDRPHTPFDLEPAERRSTIVYTIAIAVLATGLLALVAYYRQSLIWTLAGLMAAGLGVWLGMALYESRFNREREALQRRLERQRAKATDLREAFEALQRQVLGLARWLRDEGIRILNRGDIAFQRVFRHAHRHSPSALAPTVPVPELPLDGELERRFTVPLELDEPDAGATVRALPVPRDDEPGSAAAGA